MQKSCDEVHRCLEQSNRKLRVLGRHAGSLCYLQAKIHGECMVAIKADLQ